MHVSVSVPLSDEVHDLLMILSGHASIIESVKLTVSPAVTVAIPVLEGSDDSVHEIIISSGHSNITKLSR